MRRQKNEILYNVYDDISRLVLLAYPGEQSTHRHDFGNEAFIEALDDYQLDLYVGSQNPRNLEAALKHASIMASFTSTRSKRNDPDQSNNCQKSEIQHVDKYGGKVRSVTEDGEIPVTEAFVRQVVERIQGVIEAKLSPAQPPPVTAIHSPYPGLNYQASPFYPVPYPTVSPPQVVYASPNVSQPANTVQRNTSGDAKPDTRPAIIYDTKRKCWTCG